MTRKFLIRVEAIEPSGIVLTIAELPRLVIFGETAEDALLRAREAIAFQLGDSPDGDQQAPLELARSAGLLLGCRDDSVAGLPGPRRDEQPPAARLPRG